MEGWLLILSFAAAMGMAHWCQRTLKQVDKIVFMLEMIVDSGGKSKAERVSSRPTQS